MTSPLDNYLFLKGSIFAAPGGGGAPTALTPGDNGTALVRDDSFPLGVKWANTGNVSGPGTAVEGNFPSFRDATGIFLIDSGYSPDSFLPVLVSSGAAATTGSFTLSSGTHAQIATTAAVTGCIIVYTVVSLGTVTVASSFLTTIENGVGFTPVASQNTDTSTVNWAIL